MEQTETAASNAAPAPAIADTPAPSSIADHAAQFGPQASKEPVDEAPEPITALPGETPAQTAQRARDEQGRFAKERHRAKSQRATPEDVGRIGELTKRQRAAERERDEWKAKYERDMAARQASAPASAAPAATPAATSAAASSKPTWKTFEEQIGTTYQSWADAQDAYVDARDAWKDAQSAQQQQAAQTKTALETSEREMHTRYHAKLEDFVKTHPDYTEKWEAFKDEHLPGPLYVAVVGDDNGPALMYHLLTHPEKLDEMRLLSAALPPTESSVALLRRHLTQLSRTSAAATGSATVTVPHVIAPRPPNPVRTGSMKTGDEPPPDGHSIADHAKHWGPKAKR